MFRQPKCVCFFLINCILLINTRNMDHVKSEDMINKLIPAQKQKANFGLQIHSYGDSG